MKKFNTRLSNLSCALSRVFTSAVTIAAPSITPGSASAQILNTRLIGSSV